MRCITFTSMFLCFLICHLLFDVPVSATDPLYKQMTMTVSWIIFLYNPGRSKTYIYICICDLLLVCFEQDALGLKNNIYVKIASYFHTKMVKCQGNLKGIHAKHIKSKGLWDKRCGFEYKKPTYVLHDLWVGRHLDTKNEIAVPHLNKTESEHVAKKNTQTYCHNHIYVQAR